MLGIEYQHAEAEKLSLEGIRRFVEASDAIQFA
jgi:hypothetical protein